MQTDRNQQLLRDLKSTVEGLLVSQVANVWFIYGGLNRLHSDVEKIFRNGCKVSSDNNAADYWQFIQGLEWLQPDTSKSTLSIDIEYKAHIPSHVKNDKGSIWLYRSLENHSLSQKLSWLLSDKSHLLSCYQSQSFLCQEKYTEAMMICLRAVERNQPSLMSEIDPSLFLSKTSAKDYYKVHRRCSSFPDAHLKMLNQNTTSRSKTVHSMSTSLTEDEEPKISKVVDKKKTIKGKIKAWNSMPNLGIKGIKIRDRSKSIAQSRTTPTTPVNLKHHHLRKKSEDKLDSKEKEEAVNVKIETTPKNTLQVPKHVVINSDIIEHIPPSNCFHASSKSIKEDLAASLPFESKSPLKQIFTSKSAPDYSFLESISSVSGQKDYKKQPKKSFIEDGGMSVLPMSTGFFPRPTKGQSLTSFLQSSQFARANAELDRENAHFSISEAMIAAMEQLRCRRDLKLAEEQAEESDEEIMNLKQRIRMRRRQKLEESQRKMWGVLGSGNIDTSISDANTSPFSSLTGTGSDTMSSEEIDDIEIDEASNLTESRGLSMSMASLYSEADLLFRPRGAPDGASDILSAEGVALTLIRRFNEKHLPRASELEWLVSEADAPQALLPLPKSWPVSPDDNEEIPVTPLRGTREWAPPRPQIIFTLHKSPAKTELLEKQNYRCAGCGFRVEKKYSTTFRYCNYLGRYFCTQCHTNQCQLIPARVIQKWDFSRYAVSSFSYRLLEQMYADPLFRVFDLNKNIGKYSKNLRLCRKFRLGLFYMKDYINMCRYAENIQESLRNEQPYVYCDPDVYSIQDLVNIRNGEIKNRLQYLVELCFRHTAECQLCLARGFTCELCTDKTVIFPWQFKKVARCNRCGSCYHSMCWKPEEKACEKCIRKHKRKESISESRPQIKTN